MIILALFYAPFIGFQFPIDYKTVLLTYQALDGLAVEYLRSLIQATLTVSILWSRILIST